jgi:nucleotide-binding universal stress UspA family protein
MIPEIKKILYATDLSPNSNYVFRTAMKMAVRNDAEVHVLHVLKVAYGPESSSPLAAEPAQVEKYMRERLDTFVKEIADDPALGRRIASVQVVIGDPVDEILKASAKLKPDVIVMGTHSKGVIAYTFLGSVAVGVLRHSRIPVHVVPLPE